MTPQLWIAVSTSDGDSHVLIKSCFGLELDYIVRKKNRNRNRGGEQVSEVLTSLIFFYESTHFAWGKKMYFTKF